jgi:hypothetical protein
MEDNRVGDRQYKGHTITLIPSQEGYMWACRYVILKSGKTEFDGFADGNTYESRERAETAALAQAQALIDQANVNKDPLGSGY